MKPYVNFPEFEKNKKVQKAFTFLRNMLFSHLSSAYTKNKRANEFDKLLGTLSWVQWDKAIVAGFNLKGKNKALFLGHSHRWAGRSLT